MALSFGGVRLVQLTNAGGIPRADEISMDWRVLLFTLGTSLITGVLFGLAPLAPLLLSGISESLKDTAGSTTAAAGAQIFRRVPVGGELAMALVRLEIGSAAGRGGASAVGGVRWSAGQGR